MKTVNSDSIKSTWQRVRGVSRFLFKRMGEYHLPQIAGSLSFTTVLSIVPLLVIMLSVLTGFPVFLKFQKEIEQFMIDNLMPEKMSGIIMKQVGQFAAQSSRLSLVGGVMLVFSSLLTMGTVDRTFNEIWGVKRRGLMRRNVLVYWAVLTAGPVLFGLALLLNGQLIDMLKISPYLGQVLSVVVSFLSAVLGFSALYVFVPNRKVAWGDAFWGGLVAALLFVGLTQGFSAVFRQFQVYAIIYSAFSILPAFFLWLYLFWWIVLLGASLTASLPILKYERWKREPRVGGDLPEALMVLYILYKAQHSPAHMLNWDSLQAQLKLNSEDLGAIMLRLQRNGWVGKIRRTDGGTGWALICDTGAVTLANLYDEFVFDSQYFAARAQQAELPWASRLSDLHRSVYHRIYLSELFEKR